MVKKPFYVGPRGLASLHAKRGKGFEEFFRVFVVADHGDQGVHLSMPPNQIMFRWRYERSKPTPPRPTRSAPTPPKKIHPKIQAFRLAKRLRVLASPAVVARREEICRSCPSAVFEGDVLSRCTACGCAGSSVRDMIVYSDPSFCMEGKWPAELAQ